MHSSPAPPRRYASKPAAVASDALRIESSRVVDPCNPDVSASRFAVDLRNSRRNAVNPR
jgi:hypothetical protein